MALHHSFTQDAVGTQTGMPPSFEAHHPAMEASAVQRLSAWISGHLALTRSEAHSLLECMVQSGRIAHHRAEFVAAVKALAAGPNNWGEMGYRLLPDD